MTIRCVWHAPAGASARAGRSSFAHFPHCRAKICDHRRMPREIIRVPDAPSSPLYAQGVKADGWIFVSGTVGIDPATGDLAGETIEDQTRQALRNCETVLAAGGATL